MTIQEAGVPLQATKPTSTTLTQMPHRPLSIQLQLWTITSTKEESPRQRWSLECHYTATHLPTQMGRELVSKARATEIAWKVESWPTKPSLKLAGRNLWNRLRKAG